MTAFFTIKAMKKINVAIMGAGHIAEKVSATLNKLNYLNCYAVGSRSLEKAQNFAKSYNFGIPYGSYLDLVSDPKVDLVYICTPHSEHLANIKLCAEHGKNIICEKAFTLTGKQAKKAVKICKENNVFICEAIWPRYAPMAMEVKKLVASGKLGDITSVSANLGYSVWHRERVRQRSLGGGALLDVGIYCLNFFDLVLGMDFEKILVSSDIDKVEKTDKSDTVTLVYPNNVTASMFCSIVSATDRRAVIYGTKGFAVINNVNNYDSIEIFDKDRNLVKTIKCKEYITGYEFEFKEAYNCITKGLLESSVVPTSQSIKLMCVMDKIRCKAGICYNS